MGLNSPSVGIIGGTGRMGAWFARFFENQGCSVSSAGRRTVLTASAVARECEVVIVSVPIADTIGVIKELGPLVRKDGLIMDLTSIKKGPMEAMLNCSRSEVLGAHPLFGPEEKKMTDRKMVICPGRGERWLKWLTGILEKTGIRTIQMNPEEHDKLMGLIQGVNHFSTLALALCIAKSGFSFEEILNCSTRSFNQRLDRIRSILNQSPELFESLIMDNSGTAEFIEQYLDSVENMIKMSREIDRKSFREIFHSLQTFFNKT
ncbi:MAG TPA: prephenate dehydrogenase/arogenate dehydrogenase family protein [Desulfatiglandales bacterium]|nr:prephenate dehydrogenase/arogenate dehydrogenase family protein [Desulfatiglandales bacterium]